MGGNPVHDQHIVDFTACVDDALTAIQQYYDAVIETQKKEIDELKQRIDAIEKAGKAPAELEVDVKISEKSKKSFKAQLMSLFRFMF